MDGRIRFVYATCGRRYFCIRIKTFADTFADGALERPLVGCGRGDRAKSDAANTVKTRD